VAKLIHQRSHKAGLPPGSLVSVGLPQTHRPNITIVDYDQADYGERRSASVDDCAAALSSPTTTWINVDGVHDGDLIRRLGEIFDLHPLTLEDVMNTDHRPKVEDFGGYIFITLKMLSLLDEESQVLVQQVSLVLGPGWVLSFQETVGDMFTAVRDRIKRGAGRIRSRGADYLAYALVDGLVDQYFLILEDMAEEVERLEDLVLSESGEVEAADLYSFKRQVTLLRRSAWPLHELALFLLKSESDLLDKSMRAYFHDLYDNTATIMDGVNTFRDMIDGVLDVYQGTVGNRMNQIMKFLTIIATIFIPLTTIAGIYGMNFEYMPELAYRWAYPAVLLLMLGLALGMVVWFRKRKWL
jgi:magnesium transporter